MEISFNIEQAKPKDIPVLVDMRRKLQVHLENANANLLGATDLFFKNLEKRYKEYIDDHDAAIIIARDKESGKLVGMAAARIMESEEFEFRRWGRIDDVWVEPAFRQSGVCRAMLKELKHMFANMNAETIVLDYVHGNKEAAGLWEKLGFEPTLVTAVAHINNFTP